MNVYTWLKLADVENGRAAITSETAVYLLDLDTYVMTIHLEPDGYEWYAYDPETDTRAGGDGPYYNPQEAMLAGEKWLEKVQP